jgi:protein TonB
VNFRNTKISRFSRCSLNLSKVISSLPDLSIVPSKYSLKNDVMETDSKKIPGFDEIVFNLRNQSYGAYVLRKNYSRNVMISVLIAVVIMAIAIIAPYFSAKASESRERNAAREVTIKMENLDQPNEVVAPPPVAPPPSDVVQQAKYVPPVVVDSIRADENVQLMTADQAQTEVTNKDVIEIVQDAKPEIQEEETEQSPFIVVEEMPEPQGGAAGLLKYISENTIYPETARENNIQGRVIVKFCVTSKGGVDMISVLRGVDPALDAEALRVVKSLPPFKPGKQGGRTVPVWYSVPIIFQIK